MTDCLPVGRASVCYMGDGFSVRLDLEVRNRPPQFFEFLIEVTYVVFFFLEGGRADVRFVSPDMEPSDFLTRQLFELFR